MWSTKFNLSFLFFFPKSVILYQPGCAVMPCPRTARARQCPDYQLGAFAGLPLAIWLSDS